jgi:hypothetical protein
MPHTVFAGRPSRASATMFHEHRGNRATGRERSDARDGAERSAQRPSPRRTGPKRARGALQSKREPMLRRIPRPDSTGLQRSSGAGNLPESPMPPAESPNISAGRKAPKPKCSIRGHCGDVFSDPAQTHERQQGDFEGSFRGSSRLSRSTGTAVLCRGQHAQVGVFERTSGAAESSRMHWYGHPRMPRIVNRT